MCKMFTSCYNTFEVVLLMLNLKSVDAITYWELYGTVLKICKESKVWKRAKICLKYSSGYA